MKEYLNLHLNKAITLISLVITIIVLIILSSVGIYLSLGNNGIFTRSKQAKDKYINSIDEEQKQLNDVYGQMLVATGENATVTLTMKQLNDIIDERINNKLYIDTSKKIADLTLNVEYEATEDCIIAGTIGTYSATIVYMYINDICINSTYTSDDNWMYSPIYFQLKKGQKIKFINSGNNLYFEIKAFSTLK